MDDKTQDTPGAESPACKCKCANTVVALVGVLGGTAIFVGIMVWYFGRVDRAPLFMSPRGAPRPAWATKRTMGNLGLDTVVLDIVPLSELHVTIKAGKAASVEVPKDAGLTAKVEGDTVTIAAAKDAPEGARQLTVKSIKGKAATLQVNVKKARAAAEVPSAKP